MRLVKLLILTFFVGCLNFTLSVYGQSGQVASVPYVFNNGHIIIKVRVNGLKPLNFLFDSGAGGTLISDQVANSLGLEPSVSRKNVGVSGAHKVEAIKGVDIFIGDAKINNVTLLSTKTSFEEMDNGEIVHGAIGYPVLVNYVVEVDYINNVLNFYNRNSFHYDGRNGISLPINKVLDIPVVEANVKMYNGDSFVGNFILDTGARSALIISSPTVVWYEMADKVGEYYTLRKVIGTSSRRSKVRYGRLESLTFANQQFNNVPVALSSDNKGVLADTSFDGIIGNALLSRYNVIFDYYMNMIHLTPNGNIDKDFIVNTTGFNIVYEGGVPHLRDLVERSPADNAGLRNEDEIIEIDGKIVKELSSKELRAIFKKPGVKISLTVRRNNELIKVTFITRSLI